MSLWINVTAKEDVCVRLCVLCLLSEAAHTECKDETERERAFEEGDEKEEDTGAAGGEERRKYEDERDGGLGKKEKRLPCSMAGSQKQRAGPSLSDAWSQVPGSRGDGEKQSNSQATASPRVPAACRWLTFDD